MIADIRGTKLIFEIPDAVEALGYSKATKARLVNEKIKELGYCARHDIDTGIQKIINILKG